MALKLTQYYRCVHVIDHEAVVAHLLQVLKVFAAKADCTKFYLGITNDIRRRHKEHQREKPEYTLMCAIYGEPAVHVEDSFHNLERLAVQRFQGGILNPTTNRRLICENTPAVSKGKNWLYLLVDKRDIADVPMYRPGSVWAGDWG